LERRTCAGDFFDTTDTDSFDAGCWLVEGGSETDKLVTSQVPITRKQNAQNRATPIFLSGQPALKLRLAASSKWDDGSELEWAVNAAPAAAAVVGKL